MMTKGYGSDSDGHNDAYGKWRARNPSLSVCPSITLMHYNRTRASNRKESKMGNVKDASDNGGVYKNGA